MKYFNLVLLSVLLTGCGSSSVMPGGTSQNILGTISSCSSDMGVSLTSGLGTKLAASVTQGLSFDDGVVNELKGLLLSNDNVNSSNVDTMYQNYISCISGSN